MSELVKIKDSLVEAMLFFKIRKTETHQNVNTARECRLLRYNIWIGKDELQLIVNDALCE